MATNVYAIMFISIIALGVGFFGWVLPGASKAYALGTWANFPTSATCAGFTLTQWPGPCELMGNESYRHAIFTGGNVFGVQVALSVGCVNPSNTSGATLTVQWANYTTTSHTNSSNWVSLANNGVFVKIDNSANSPCPGTLLGTPQTIQRTGINSGFMFRVIGNGGGGSGDNPRFSFIDVSLKVNMLVPFSAIPTSPSTTGFTAQINIPITRPDLATTVNYNWLAENATVVASPLKEDGTGTCSIAAGASGCTQAITFTIAFAATPVVFLQMTTGSTTVQLPIGAISMLSAETVSV